MTKFYHVICPVCGAYKSESSWSKPFRKMPFARLAESLGRASLKTLKVIVSPFALDLTPVKKRLLLAVRSWYDIGVITDENLDEYLCDMISSFNEWARESSYEDAAFRGYTEVSDSEYYSSSEFDSQPLSSGKQNVTRVRKAWK